MVKQLHDVIIIGGGPAGLMAANEFESNGIDYVILEKNSQLGKKLLLTGGKRCNVTNNLSVEDFIERLTLRNKRFLYPSMYQFSTDSVIEFMNAKGVELVLENNFKYFPKSSKSITILNALTKDIDLIKVKYNEQVIKVKNTETAFHVVTKNKTYYAKYVLVCTGSNSFPSTGSSGDGNKLADLLSIKTVPFTPAETHIYLNEMEKYIPLQGTSIEEAFVRIKDTKISHHGDLLFTHFGLSGPVIYHLSEFIHEEIQRGNKTLQISLTTLTYQELMNLQNDKTTILKTLQKVVTKRLAKYLLDYLDLDNRNNSEISNKQKETIIKALLQFEVTVNRVEAKEKAYVNKGGVDLKEITPNTMNIKQYPGLYIAGEAMNIHGPIGGFNITIAFSTGLLAARSIIEELKLNC